MPADIVPHRPQLRPTPANDAPGPNPYVNYSRRLTDEGGVLFTYKDIDTRWRYTLWRLFAWSCATWLAYLHLFHEGALRSAGLKFLLLLAAALLNWLIVRKPVELYRTAEIRPDCLILDGTDVFWLNRMENAPPVFHEDEDGNLVLAGPYGDRFVEYVTARHFDENDRMPEVLAAHFEQAIEQLWAPAIALGNVRPASQPFES